MLKMKKILGILCHPDDEVLQGWPIFQRTDIEKHLVILCNGVRRKGIGRMRALEAVCSQENINLYCAMAEDNNFYALPTRRSDYTLGRAVKHINHAIAGAVNEIQPDLVFSHNPVGEYGHGSHRLCFELVSQHPSVKDLIFTDICQESNHRSSSVIPKVIQEAYYASDYTMNENMQKLDMQFYERCYNTYMNHRAWTWSKPPITKCNLYYLRTQNV